MKIKPKNNKSRIFFCSLIYQHKKCLKYFVYLQIQALCLPFLRIAALLRHHLYEQELPIIHPESNEFVILVYFLELVEGNYCNI